MINVGIIGLGHMGGYHASVCSLLTHVNLVGIADPDTKNWAKIKNQHTIKTTNYHDWIELVDAVIIAVPTDFHYSIAKDCLLRGKHVFIEKPLTKSIEEAEELFSLAYKSNLALHVGHVERFNGAVQELKKIIDKPFLIESHRMGPFQPRVQGDSLILDLMIHDLDIILNLVNSPVKKLHTHGSTFHTSSCDLATVQIQFENGVIANLVSSRVSQIKKRTMEIHQEKSYILLDFTTQDIAIHRHASSSVHVGSDALKYKQESMIEHLFVYKDNPLKLEVEYFVNAIREKQNLFNPEQDLSALNITFDIERQLGIR
ncbi:Gfo/Idh/MocA family oxidoreductase [Candidatus Babeliales bacterium]|nr:Gfo/Idh/MocA family oxidoreductase [Candidatus Babeliales bacterium]